jgi:hypothetical protein
MRRRCRRCFFVQQIGESFPDTALVMRNLAQRETHLDATQRAAQHEIVEPAEMSNPEYAPGELA